MSRSAVSMNFSSTSTQRSVLGLTDGATGPGDLLACPLVSHLVMVGLQKPCPNPEVFPGL